MPYCPHCNAVVYDTATACYRCGAPLIGEGGPADVSLDPNVRLDRWRRGRIQLLLWCVISVLVFLWYLFH